MGGKQIYYANTNDQKTDKFFEDTKEVEVEEDSNESGYDSNGVYVMQEDDCEGGACSI